MSQRDNVFYDVPEWDEVRSICSYDLEAEDVDLLAKVAHLDTLIPVAIAACDMLDNKVHHLSAAQEDDFMLAEEFGQFASDERFAACTKKCDGTRHALSHLKARTNYMIAAHGGMRAVMGLDPVFAIKA